MFSITKGRERHLEHECLFHFCLRGSYYCPCSSRFFIRMNLFSQTAAPSTTPSSILKSLPALVSEMRGAPIPEFVRRSLGVHKQPHSSMDSHWEFSGRARRLSASTSMQSNWGIGRSFIVTLLLFPSQLLRAVVFLSSNREPQKSWIRRILYAWDPCFQFPTRMIVTAVLVVYVLYMVRKRSLKTRFFEKRVAVLLVHFSSSWKVLYASACLFHLGVLEC